MTEINAIIDYTFPSCPCWDLDAVNAAIAVVTSGGSGTYEVDFEYEVDQGEIEAGIEFDSVLGEAFLVFEQEDGFNSCASAYDGQSRGWFQISAAQGAACWSQLNAIMDNPCALDNGSCSDRCLYLGPGARECVECTDDSDCAGNANGSVCDPSTHVYVECRSEADCDDGNPCTVDQCDVAGACGHDAQALEATPCDADGDACTSVDLCTSGTCTPGVATQCEFGACSSTTGLCPPSPYACPCFDAAQVAAYFVDNPPSSAECFPAQRLDQYPAVIVNGGLYTTGPGTGLGGNGTTQCQGPNGFGSNYAGGFALSFNMQANCADLLRTGLGLYGVCGCSTDAHCDDHDACSADQCISGVCSYSFDSSCNTP